jgi:hypothetical protein
VLRAAGSIAIAGVVSRRVSLSAFAQDATPSAGNYPVVEVTAENYKFTLPESISGGWTELTFHNKGPEDHHAMFMKLNEGTSFDEFKQAADAATDLGALFAKSVCIGGAPSISAGQTASTILNIEPGNYAVVCVIPDESGKPHYLMGMINSLTVTEAASQLSAPQSDQSIDLTEFKFMNLPDTVSAGSHTWEVKDTGQQLHEFVVYQILAPGMTVEQVKGILSAPPATPAAGMSTPEATGSPSAAGAPPFLAIGGTAPVSPGYTNYALLDLKAGNYFAICFVPDVATGAPHFSLGMIMGFTVS